MTEAQKRRGAKRAAWLAGKQEETARREAVRPAVIRDAQGRRIHIDGCTAHRGDVGRSTAHTTYIKPRHVLNISSAG